MGYKPEQELDEWVDMLDRIYGSTQNYNKSKYEIYSHLVEVVGAFGKYTFKKRDFVKSVIFLPKMFAWALMLFRKIKKQSDIRNVILSKYPTVCYYCAKKTCDCYSGEKHKVNINGINELFRLRSNSVKSLSQFQLMFESIYEESWGITKEGQSTDEKFEKFKFIYIRLTEELSEMAEAMRFYHINSSNFENEFADYFAWWIALVSSIHHVSDGMLIKLDIEKFIWNEYPGYCRFCGLNKCDCRPGPVRELLSKPSPHEFSIIDTVTLSYNSVELNQTIDDIAERRIPSLAPITILSIDLKGLNYINGTYGEDIGDDILRLIANTIRIRISYKYKLFRTHQHGDEFIIICQDFSAEEAKGMAERIIKSLQSTNFHAKNNKSGEKQLVRIMVSIGISTCDESSKIADGIKKAKESMYLAKEFEGSHILINSK